MGVSERKDTVSNFAHGRATHNRVTFVLFDVALNDREFLCIDDRRAMKRPCTLVWEHWEKREMCVFCS
jgi:hypothetical protein